MKTKTPSRKKFKYGRRITKQEFLEMTIESLKKQREEFCTHFTQSDPQRPQTSQTKTEDSCFTCAGNFKRKTAITLDCGHMYHLLCKKSWADTYHKCPACPEGNQGISDVSRMIGNEIGVANEESRVVNEDILGVNKESKVTWKEELEMCKENRAINENSLEICPICYDELLPSEQLLLKCTHKFHKTCILRWGRLDTKCPLCKAKMLCSKTEFERWKKRAIEKMY